MPATNPTMLIVRNSSKPDAPSTFKAPAASFTGDVYVDSVFATPTTPTEPVSAPSTSMSNVTFTPGARTYWHHHEGGQILQVLAGAGWVCDEGGAAQRIRVGDTVYCPPGTTHWHGADEGSYLTHTAITMGRTEWRGEVSEEVYAMKKA